MSPSPIPLEPPPPAPINSPPERPGTTPRPAFVPSRHYWHVGGDEASVYSSALGDFVQTDDPTYLAWVASGLSPSRIASTDELGAVLCDHEIPATNVTVSASIKKAHAAKIVATRVFRVLFQHENRLRAIERALGLNGSPADLTQAQARAAIQALM